MHEDTHFNPKSLNIRTYCKMLSKSVETFTRSAKCLQRRLKPPRAPRNAFRALGNGCALCKIPSESSEMAAHSAKYFPNPRKQLRAPRNAFPNSRKPPCALRSPSRILGNLHTLRKMPSEYSETFTLRKTKGSPLSLNHPNLCEGLPTC